MHPVTRADFDQYMVPNYAPAQWLPVRGQGSRLWDQHGRDYLDLAAGIAVTSLGHCHPAMVKALTEQAQQLWHVSNTLTNEPALRLARKLVDATFAERVFFCNSGAEANEAAFKLARKVASDRDPARDEIIAASNSFHGRTLFTVSVGGQPKYSEGLGPRPQAISHVPYNDIAALRAAVSARTCAIVVEPVQGEGGVLPASREYLQAARELADAHGALLIFDEVQTGVGRTGALYAYQQYGVVPDILTSAKGLGGGFPIGAMLTTSEIAQHFSVGTHGTTYGGNPLACAVAEAVIDTVNTAEVQANVTARAAQLRAGLEALNAELGLFAEVRGMGLLLGAVLNDHYAGRAGEVVAKAAEAGVIVLQAGPNVVRFAPSLVIGEDEVSEALGRLGSALQAFAG
ncbi:aspartate aminotransferase family protein [Rivihabitans pingtungensis]|uniref:aspartate aminotransferase family protein n=2 Tax=Rivihabitans pingtungensis TaxID=1054498 RepID=UPI002FD8AA93